MFICMYVCMYIYIYIKRIRPNKRTCTNKCTPSFLCESKLHGCISQLCASLISVATQYFIVLQLEVDHWRSVLALN